MGRVGVVVVKLMCDLITAAHLPLDCPLSRKGLARPSWLSQNPLRVPAHSKGSPTLY